MIEDVIPNFLVIGAAKCGTTSLHGYLSQHADIYMPKVKEISFFLADDAQWGTWNRGLKWYASLFRGADAIKRRGEASPAYTLEAETAVAARKIHDVLGSPKLIYFVRDPISRLKSHYLEDYYGYGTAGDVPLDDIVANKGRPDADHYALYGHYIHTSMYDRQLERYRRYHELENIFIRTQEEFRSDRTGVMKDVFEFLGVDPTYADRLRSDDRNITASKRKRVRDPFGPLKRFGWYPPVSGSVPQLIKRGYRRLTSIRVSNAELTYISEANLDHLASVFEPDLEALYRSTGVRVPLGRRLAFENVS